MLSDLLEVDKGVLQPFADSCHTTQRRALELFALEQTLSILQKTHVITGNSLNQRLRGRQLAERNTEMTENTSAEHSQAKIFHSNVLRIV